ncbi:MAG: demethoxyubiquinone hydroxylase family protein [Pseudomonadota bacterium]
MSATPKTALSKPRRMQPGPRAQRIAEILRVDHAGEYGAVAIYRGQHAAFRAVPHKMRTAAMIKEMEEGEAEHLETFDRLLLERGMRPSLLSPLWNGAGFALGAVTALIGEKTAMAATEAVETVIEEHYAAQADELGDTDPDLAETLMRFRDEELAHKETAQDAGASDAPLHGVLSAIIAAGCRIAIKVAEKV